MANKAADAGADGGGRSGKNMADGIVAALVSIPIAGALVAIAKAAGDAVVQGFQEGLAVEVRADRLAATTGLDEATVGRLGQAAGEAYAQNWGESIEANMDTARAAIQSGLLDPQATERDAQAIIESLSGVSDILGEEIPRVTRSAQQLLRTGLAKDAEQAFDIIVKGQQAGLNVSEDWLDTLDEYSIQWQKLGLEGGDVLGLLSQGVQAGARDTDIAADAFKEFAIRAVDGSDLTKEGFDAIGLSAADMSSAIGKGGKTARDALDLTLDGLRAIEDPVKRDAAAVALFGTQAEDLGAALFAMDLDTAAKGFEDLDGAAANALSTLGGNTAGTIAMAQRNIEVAADGIKGALANAFAPQIEGFATFVSENREAVVTFLFDAANGAIDFGRAIVEGTAAGTEALGDFGGSLVPLIDGLADMAVAVDKALPGDQESKAFREWADGAVENLWKFDKGTEVSAEAIRKNLIENGLDPAQDKLNDLGSGLIDNAALSDATNRLAGEISGVGYAADGSQLQVKLLNGQFDTTTRAGKRLDGQVRAVRDGLYEQVSAAAAAGEGQKELRGRVASARAAFVDQMTAMGLTGAEANRLADKYGLIPEKVLTEANLQDNASAKARGIKGEIDAIPSQKTVTITSILEVIGEGPSQYVTKRASGGPVGPEYGTVLVGEEGPELVRFAQAGTVVPAAQTAALMSSGGNATPSSRTYNANVYNYGGDAAVRSVTRAQRRAELLELWN
ncbi:hypothetical protein J2S48_004720 [Promicromonospora iranensis]|uniref:Phage tail tape measure protein domain-containing protein n=1 Tax=Promicromonospora iranensis TaxID=1105144 RepID=A0ABU2CV36_9MICO|nr:hypothetical protein [Promicromonospora iranensis]